MADLCERGQISVRINVVEAILVGLPRHLVQPTPTRNTFFQSLRQFVSLCRGEVAPGMATLEGLTQ